MSLVFGQKHHPSSLTPPYIKSLEYYSQRPHSGSWHPSLEYWAESSISISLPWALPCS